MEGTVRGDGLIKVHNALAAIAGDQQQLDRARLRFETTPPPYASQPSGTTTRSDSPDLRTDKEKRDDELYTKLMRQHDASDPQNQFNQQVFEEKQRMAVALGRHRDDMVCDINATEMGREIVKKRWVEQGIWKDKWEHTPFGGRWDHKEPLEFESDEETDLDASPPKLSSGQSKVRRLKTTDSRRQTTEQCIIRERQREASRPYHQFIYQMSKEREHMHNESINSSKDRWPDDVNTKAYEVVKQRWEKRQIWNERWGVMPGMLWLCEKPFPDVLEENGIPMSPEERAHDDLTRKIAIANTRRAALDVFWPDFSVMDDATTETNVGQASQSLREKSPASSPGLPIFGFGRALLAVPNTLLDQDIASDMPRRRSPRFQRQRVDAKEETNKSLSTPHQGRNGTRKARAKSSTKLEGVSKKRNGKKTPKRARTKAK